MTSLITVPAQRAPERTAPVPPEQRAPRRRSPGRLQRLLTGPAPWLAIIWSGQVALSRVTHGVRTPFEDEGLYVYMGHRMLDHFLHGAFLQEFPGSYFSGAPGLYPVLAALVDDVGGIGAVRDLSLVFVLLTTLGVHGIGSELFGRVAGVLGAASFAVCGSVVFVSQWATFDAMTMALLSLAGWLTLWSARRHALLWAPAVGIVLALAVLTKYAGLAYVPFVVALAVTQSWGRLRWLVVRRAVFTVAATGALVYFILMLWGRDLLPGIVKTTTDRTIIAPTSRHDLVANVMTWVGPWLLLAVLGAALLVLRDPRRVPTVLVLLGAGVVGPAQQVHIGEGTSLSKHVAFGLVFTSPLVGYLGARLVQHRWVAVRAVGLVAVVAVLAPLTSRGIAQADVFRDSYSDDTRLVGILRQVVAMNPGKPVLGEKPSPERYALRGVVRPRQWNDTFEFAYAGLSGPAAYERALRDHYFGVIYLNFTTANAGAIVANLGPDQPRGHYYNLVAKVPRHLRGEVIGYTLVWAPQQVHFTPVD